MPHINVVIAILVLGVVTPAFPCSTVAPPPPRELVQLADVIVRTRAERVSPEPGRDALSNRERALPKSSSV